MNQPGNGNHINRSNQRYPSGDQDFSYGSTPLPRNISPPETAPMQTVGELLSPEVLAVEVEPNRPEYKDGPEEIKRDKEEIGYRDWSEVNGIFHFDEWTRVLDWYFCDPSKRSPEPIDVDLGVQTIIGLPAPKRLFMAKYTGHPDGVAERARFARVQTGRTSASDKPIVHISFWKNEPSSLELGLGGEADGGTGQKPSCTIEVEFAESTAHGRDSEAGNDHNFGSDRTMLIRPDFRVWSPNISEFEDSVYQDHHKLHWRTELTIAEIMKQYGEKVWANQLAYLKGLSFSYPEATQYIEELLAARQETHPDA